MTRMPGDARPEADDRVGWYVLALESRHPERHMLEASGSTEPMGLADLHELQDHKDLRRKQTSPAHKFTVHKALEKAMGTNRLCRLSGFTTSWTRRASSIMD